jgi:hypothetical protein
VERGTAGASATATDLLLAGAARVLQRAEALQELSERTFGSTGSEPSTPAADDPGDRSPASVGDAVSRLLYRAQELVGEALSESLRSFAR